MSDSDDATLARALIARDPQAPRVLWQRYAPMVFRMLKRALGPDHDLEDLAQEVFLCVFEKVRGLREPKALKAFVISVTVADDPARAAPPLGAALGAAFGKSPTPPSTEVVSTDTDAREALARFYEILDRVNVNDRTAFVLRYMEGLELTEVAAALGALARDDQAPAGAGLEPRSCSLSSAIRYWFTTDRTRTREEHHDALR